MSFDPTRLYAILLNTGLQTKDNALYQLLRQLIANIAAINTATNTLSAGGGGSTNVIQQIIQSLSGIDIIDSFDEPLIITGILPYTTPTLFGISFPLGTFLTEDALGVLSVKAGLNQTNLFLYNTFTDSSNYEREFIGWSGNTFFITTNIAGTGVARNMLIGTNSLGNLDFRTNNISRWEITAAAGHIIAFTDNVQDIGAVGANRPRTGYFGTSLIAPIVTVDSVRGTGGTLDLYTSGVARWEMSGGNLITFADNTYSIGLSSGNRPSSVFAATSVVAPNIVTTVAISSPLWISAAGPVTITPFNGLITFGGTTSAFPAIKRTATSVGFRLADDSADAPISTASYTHSGAEIDKTYVVYTPLTGATITMSAGQSRAIVNPAGLIAALTITLPPSPVDGQVAGFSFTQAVTVLTVNAPGGATVVASPTSAAVDTAFRFLYQASSTTWFPAS